MLVVDASVAVKWIIDEPGSLEARALFSMDNEPDPSIREIMSAPALLLIEVHYAIAKRYLKGEAKLEQLSSIIPALTNVFGAFVALDAELAESAAEISFATPRSSRRSHLQPFGVYDCVYIALAKKEGATLVTADARQAEFAAHVNIPVRTLRWGSEREIESAE
jgi:predicted nucleic acid-binding protein